MMEIIDTYTRKEAIADGFQVALASMGFDNLREKAGYKYPIYFTSGIIGLIEGAQNMGDEFGLVVWDILYMSRANARTTSDRSISFQVIINGSTHEIWVECAATDIDDPAPCLTFMLPSEY